MILTYNLEAHELRLAYYLTCNADEDVEPQIRKGACAM